MTTSVRIEGVEGLQRNLARVQANMECAAAAAIYQLANNIMADSVERTPLDLGPLRASAYVTIPEVGSSPHSEIGYGGPARSYAEAQHKNSSYRHEVGESHFLKNALEIAKPTAERDLAALLRHNFEAGSGPGGGGFPQAPQAGEAVDRKKAAKRKKAAARKWARKKVQISRRQARNAKRRAKR